LLPPSSPLIRRCCQLLPAALVISFPNQPLLVAVELRASGPAHNRLFVVILM
jgi:hypothetical protein